MPEWTDDDVTAVVVNYRTLDLTRACIESLTAHFPHMPLVAIDNASGDGSTTYLEELATRRSHIRVVLNAENRFHGPAMDQGIHLAGSSLVLLLDSDCEVRGAGFLHAMIDALRPPDVYAAGRVVHVNRFGYEQAGPGRWTLPYAHPSTMLLRRERYLELKPFIHHGSPCMANMRDAAKRGYRLANVRLDPDIHHRGEGTCGRYGYGLGLRDRIEGSLNWWLERIGVMKPNR